MLRFGTSGWRAVLAEEFTFDNARRVVTAIARHEHREVVAPYGHANLGFTAKELTKMAGKAGLHVTSCGSVMREKRPPHFEVLALHAVKG